jgi:hypothetical protein
MAEVNARKAAIAVWAVVGPRIGVLGIPFQSGYVDKKIDELTEIIDRAYAESGRQGEINCFCEMPDCPQCSPLPIPSSTNTESGQDEYRRGWEDCQKDYALGDPLYPLYQEYASMVPPKGQTRMTYSGWLRSLAAKIRCERDTPERSHAGQEEVCGSWGYSGDGKKAQCQLPKGHSERCTWVFAD